MEYQRRKRKKNKHNNMNLCQLESKIYGVVTLAELGGCLEMKIY